MASGITKSTPKKYESRHLLLSDALGCIIEGIVHSFWFLCVYFAQSRI